MKRASSSSELEPVAKRRRVEQRETLERSSHVLDVIEDFPAFNSSMSINEIEGVNKDPTNYLPPITPDNVDTPLIDGTVTSIAHDSMSVDNATTICNVPLEVLGNHVFKFFDFSYWLKHFVTVCKYWQLAAKQSTVDKQLHILQVGLSLHVIKRYKVSTLIIHCTVNLYQMAALIRASPAIHSVHLNHINITKNENIEASYLTPALNFPSVSTVAINYGYGVKCLKSFPNATRLCILKEENVLREGYKFPSVQELSLPSTERIKYLLPEMKATFPSMHTLYYGIDDPMRARASEEEFDEVSRDLGVSTVLIGQMPKVGTISSHTSYADYFNCYETTPFCHAVEESDALHELQRVFERFPTLTLAYEEDFQYRSRQFEFPYGIQSMDYHRSLTDLSWSNCEEEDLMLCLEKEMLPPASLFKLKMQQRDYSEAFKYIVLDPSVDMILLAEEYASLSLVQLSNEMGAEKFKSMLSNEVFLAFLQNIPTFEDMTPIKDLLSYQILQNACTALLSKLLKEISSTQWQYLVLIDSWLHPNTSRRVADQPCIGIQYLSDEAQAEYIVLVLQKQGDKHLWKYTPKLSKPMNQIFYEGKSLLIYTNNISAMVKEYKMNVNQIDLNGCTPLIHVIQKADVSQIEELLELGADPNFAGNTPLPLHFCLMQENYSFDILTVLLAYGADVNRQDYDSKGRTVWPITLALKHDMNTIKYLLHMRACPTVEDEAGNKILHLLLIVWLVNKVNEVGVFKDMMKVFTPMIDINAENNAGETVLNMALAANLNTEVVRIIIDSGADVNHPDARGWTPLMQGCYKREISILKVLLATNKVDIRARAMDGSSFLDKVLQYDVGLALEDEEFKVVCKPYLTEDNLQFLKDECKTIGLDNIKGLVAKHIILARFFVDLGYDVKGNSYCLLDNLTVHDVNNCEVFDFLLANGLDVNAKNEEQEPFLVSLMMKEVPLHKKIARKIQLLLKHGASVTEKNCHGTTAIDIDPLIESKYTNGVHVDYLYACSDKKICNVNLTEFR